MKSKYRTYIFISVEVVLYLTFLYFDIQNALNEGSEFKYVNIIKYISIFLCFLFSLAEGILRNHLSVLTFALGFSAIADIFLIFTSYFSIGIFFFICVQTCYRYILSGKKGVFKMYVFCFIVCAISYTILIILNLSVNITTMIAIFYSCFLICNVIKACLKAFTSNQTSLTIFCAGIILLFLCDINVGLYNSKAIFNYDFSFIPSFFIEFSTIGMWLFYLPSQIIMALLSLKPVHFSFYK
ncbi:lysoplasmalogenase family protein [Anaerosacchariphilus polymeriproducens]|uniref:YhhN-like protein n=1 Tax=Anaerosacchariphilus polymeriproducens TaxID=1812858 RepID=A0A371ASU7_9FIRM|nr:hypothetical protein DWV06_15320 [Anaerosacchariphilus polymeriproducens]